jgi:hypothetical protein
MSAHPAPSIANIEPVLIKFAPMLAKIASILANTTLILGNIEVISANTVSRCAQIRAGNLTEQRVCDISGAVRRVRAA